MASGDSIITFCATECNTSKLHVYAFFFGSGELIGPCPTIGSATDLEKINEEIILYTRVVSNKNQF